MNDIEILEELKEFLLSITHEPQYNINQYTSAIENLIQRNKDLEQIEQEHKEENGRLREKVKKYETMIINHKKQLSKSGIYGYDYDLKLLEESEK